MRDSWLVAALCCLPLFAVAQTEEEASPDLALLDFLGSFETQDDSWLEGAMDEENGLLPPATEEEQNHEQN